MKKPDLSKLSEKDLLKELAEKREGLRAFQFGGAGSRSKNVREGRARRKEIARILTESRSRSIGVASEAKSS